MDYEKLLIQYILELKMNNEELSREINALDRESSYVFAIKAMKYNTTLEHIKELERIIERIKHPF